MELPSRVGIMDLPNAILFPQALLPLYIFEPRYQHMLAQILEDQRMFAVALSGSREPQAVAGVGLVRACVHHPDGTSNLVLQGVARVRFTRFVQRQPYFVAEIECLQATSGSTEKNARVARQILEIVNRTFVKKQQVPEWMIKFLDDLQDFEVLADLTAYTFIEDVQTKQAILEELNLHRRLEQVREALLGQTNEPEL